MTTAQILVVVGAVWLALSIVAAIAWVSLMRDRRIKLAREQMNAETLACILRQPVDEREVVR
jgi:hypothetical protein